MTNAPKQIVVAITGASGGPYALRFLDCLDAAGVQVHLVISPHGRRLLSDECNVRSISVESLIGRPSSSITLHDYRDVGCRLASGSFLTDSMVICPCSSNTLGAVASGIGDNLVARSAQVTLKEGRRLILLHREMPLSSIDLENMLKLQRAGAIICPASPGFYLRPQSLADLVDFVVGRLLDLIGISHNLAIRWQEPHRQGADDRAVEV